MIPDILDEQQNAPICVPQLRSVEGRPAVPGGYRIVKRQVGALENVTSALGCGDGAIAPALSVIVSGAILMTVPGAHQAQRGAEPGCLARPAITASISSWSSSTVFDPLVTAVSEPVDRICGLVCGARAGGGGTCRRPSPCTWG